MKHFITSIKIKKIRHLENITIPLSETEPKHLILTGKNGSGKTSVIEKLRDFLSSVKTGQITNIPSLRKTILYRTQQLDELDKKENLTLEEQNQKSSITKNIKSWESSIANTAINEVEITFSYFADLQQQYEDGKLLLAYFSVGRINKMADPQGPNKFEPNKIYADINVAQNNNDASQQFLQYLVNLKTQKAEIITKHYDANSGILNVSDDDIQTVKKLDDWFDNFEKLLKQIFNDNDLFIDYKGSPEYKFYIHTKGREPFTFNELSSGYSAVIKIVTELMMRMEQNKTNSYDIEGVVLIDEVETHLHVELQKNILPFLTTFFPNVQFIVTTHSPFVLQSISNAVIYDLENKTLVEDLSAYSWNGIVENYFNVDQYSVIIKQKMHRYEMLKKKDSLLDNESTELKALENSLRSIDKNISPELATHVKQLIIKYGAVNV